jgi:hypothetical protein
VTLHVSEDAPSAFLSHTHHDQQLAQSLATALAAERIRTWRFETDVEQGDNIVRCVRKALETSDCLAVLVTESSIASLWVLTELEGSVGLETPIAMVLDTTNPLLVELFEAVRFPSLEPKSDTRIHPSNTTLEGLQCRYESYETESRSGRYVGQATDFMATLPEYLRPWPRREWTRMPMVAFPSTPRVWDGEIELVRPSVLFDLIHHLER